MEVCLVSRDLQYFDFLNFPGIGRKPTGLALPNPPLSSPAAAAGKSDDFVWEV